MWRQPPRTPWYSSSRHRQRMFWCSTGLSTHTLYLAFFTGWNLHKVCVLASGVEQCVLYPRDSELPVTVGQRKQGRGIIGANLGPVRVGAGTAAGASSATAFPSLDEDREYAPAKGEGITGSSPSLGPRYNIEEDYYDQDSTSESESEDGGSSRFVGGRVGRKSRRRSHGSQHQLEQFEFTFGNLIDDSKSVKCFNLSFSLKSGADFMVVKALTIGASPGEL